MLPTVLLGMVFGCLASVMAFLIIYREYSKHRLGKGRVLKEALIGAGFTLLVFLVFAIISTYLLRTLIR